MSLKTLNGIRNGCNAQLYFCRQTVNMAPALVKKHLPLLQYPAKGKPRINKAIIEESNPEVIKVICECAKNTLYGNVKLSPVHLNKLKRYKTQLRQLSDKKTGIKQKKRVLQKGGFLGALLGAIIPTLASVISQ